MEERSFHPMPNDNGDSGLDRYLRDIPPAHYTLKIESLSALSKLLEDAKLKNYESDIFEAGGFKWKLSVYPNGNIEGKGEGHISLYLVIVDTDKLPMEWEVNVNFKLFVYDQIHDKYMAVQDANGKVRRFYNMKTEWGFDRLLPLGTFNDANNGYLVHDKCAFGAEVFVINYSGRWESVAVIEGKAEAFTWKIDKFSSLNQSLHYSDVFTSGNLKWKLWLYPKGDTREQGKYMSLFIELLSKESFPSERKTLAKYLLRVKDQKNGKHEDFKSTDCFAPSTYAWGRSSFLSLTRLRDASTGFLVKDTLVIEAQIESISTVKNFSK